MQQYPLKKRATATSVPTHRAGHSSPIHPEDAPYWTDQRKKYANPLDVADQLDYPGEPTRLPSSAVRYVDRQGNMVIQRDNQRFVIHDEPPPRQRRQPHWLLIFGIGMIVMVAFFIIWNWGGAWWANHQLYATYGFPRTYQVDAVVYPGDTSDHPSHYIFLNLNGTVLVVEFPHGDATHARTYRGPTLYSDQANQIPVTGEFKVVNNHVEMLVHIQDQTIVYVNDGTQFKPQ